MCGICGVALYPSESRIDESILISMRDSLIHRGTDDSGLLIDRQIGLGHRRLSIIDLSTGAQPVHNEDSTIWVVFNGEIYNYRDIRSDLKKRGHKFYTRSDTETLVHLYEEYGERMLDKINGMFAFCIWDRKGQEMFLARDRIGEKPLFYSFSKDAFIFASELKAILKYPSTSRVIDMLSLSKYLTYEYVPAPNSIFKYIKKLKPGHFMTYKVSSKEVIIKKYWDIPLLDDAIAHKTEEEYAEELIELLRESVRLRLISDVPLGIFLSGGIDSSIITALATEQSDRVQTFTVSFKEKSFDESGYAAEIAKGFNTVHHSEVLDVEKAYTLLPEIMNYLDEPLGDASVIPTFLLSRFTSKKVKATLGGDGGDELFAGYPTFQALKLIHYYDIFPKELRNIIHKIAAKFPVSHKNISFDFKIKQLLRGAGVSPEIMFFLWMGSFNESEKRQLLLSDVRESIKDENPFEDIFNYLKESNLHKNLERALYLSMKLYLQDDILTKVDRTSMANSLEVRAPFLDYKFVEFAAKLPTVYKLNRLTTKYLLKKAFRDILPAKIIKRGKKGFGIPIAKWIHGDMKDIFFEYLNEDRIKKEGIFEYSFIKRLMNEHLSRSKDNRKLLWTLLIFQMWKEKWG